VTTTGARLTYSQKDGHIDLAEMAGWLHHDMIDCKKVDTHLATNHTWCRAVLLIKAATLTVSKADLLLVCSH